MFASMLSVFFYILMVVFTLIYFIIFCVAYVITVPFDKNRLVLHYLSREWTKCYFGIVPTWKIECEGMENIDRDNKYVIVVNHRSMIDILLMYVIPLNFKWVSKKEVYRWPIFGWVLKMHGDIAIERGTAQGVKKLVRESRQWLDRGVSVIIFPEGSRSKTDSIQRFKEGAFMLAKETGADLLPCVTVGTGTASKGWRINFRNRFKVKVLPPVPASEIETVSTKDLTRRMQELMTAEFEKLKRE